MCTILVGMSTCGMSAGAKETYKSLQGLVNGSDHELTFTGCIGMCFREPLVEIRDGDTFVDLVDAGVEGAKFQHLGAGWSNKATVRGATAGRQGCFDV